MSETHYSIHFTYVHRPYFALGPYRPNVSLPTHMTGAWTLVSQEGDYPTYRIKKRKTRSSATAEKQRVSYPHGGGARPSSPLPRRPPLAMRLVESETHDKRTSSVPSTKRTLS